MSVTININGDLVLDQTAGLQTGADGDDVAVTNSLGTLTGGLDSDFLNYLNSLGLLNGQKNFADLVEGASDPNLVTVTASAGETVAKLFFSDASGNDFDGDLVPDTTTIDGDPLYFWSALGGKVVLVSTSNAAPAPAPSSIVAAFYIEGGAGNTTAVVQSITFSALSHPDTNSPDDTVDFSDVLRVSAVITQAVGDNIDVDDDGPTIVTSDSNASITVDETDLTDSNSASFATDFTSAFGTDGAGGIVYTLDTVGGTSGLIDTLSQEAVILSETGGGSIEGRTQLNNELVFTVSVNPATGEVTLDQDRAVVHDPNNGPDDSETLADDSMISLTATITDKDGDHRAATRPIGQNLNFLDDIPIAPTVTANSSVVEDETPGLDGDSNDSGDAAVAARFAGVVDTAINFAKSPAPLVSVGSIDFGNDGPAGTGSVHYALSVVDGADSGLDTTAGQSIFLFNSAVPGVIVGRVGDVNGAIAFAITVDQDGFGYIAHKLSVSNPITTNSDDPVSLIGDSVKVVVSVTDGDGDQAASAAVPVGSAFTFQDDGPTITKAFDGDPGTAGLQGENLLNTAGTIATGNFGFDLGSDATNYAGGGSDFASFSLTGTVGTPAVPITTPSLTKVSEDANSATFNWSFHFDTDPITAGVQDGTAGGTFTIDKSADTYSIDLADKVEGFSFSVLHSSNFLSKAPPGNTGHPEIVVSELDVNNGTTDTDGFYVQFTANSNPGANAFGFNGTGDGSPIANDTLFDAGQFVTSNFEDWVSATQSTNGVAGDTIQKGELLTLRFFNENIKTDVVPGAPGGGTERLVETDAVQGVAIKFDGIGAAEDLIVILDLIDRKGTPSTADDVTTTRSVIVDNGDMIKGTVPSPYNTQFSLDNNDALVVIESNDFNVGTENFSIQGMQIMQSGNGLTGTGINLNGAVGSSGNSTSTQLWENSDNDVLKITDIGFIQTTSGTQDANLNFNFTLHDGDGDTTLTQTLGVHIADQFLI